MANKSSTASGSDRVELSVAAIEKIHSLRTKSNSEGDPKTIHRALKLYEDLTAAVREESSSAPQP